MNYNKNREEILDKTMRFVRGAFCTDRRVTTFDRGNIHQQCWLLMEDSLANSTNTDNDS